MTALTELTPTLSVSSGGRVPPGKPGPCTCKATLHRGAEIPGGPSLLPPLIPDGYTLLVGDVSWVGALGLGPKLHQGSAPSHSEAPPGGRNWPITVTR